MGNSTENTLEPSVFTTLCEAHGAMREQDDRRYHYSVTCLLPPGDTATDLPGDEIMLILRELDTVDPEEFTLTVVDLRAATPLREGSWHIPALDWVLTFYRHVPITHSTPDAAGA